MTLETSYVKETSDLHVNNSTVNFQLLTLSVWAAIINIESLWKRNVNVSHVWLLLNPTESTLATLLPSADSWCVPIHSVLSEFFAISWTAELCPRGFSGQEDWVGCHDSLCQNSLAQCCYLLLASNILTLLPRQQHFVGLPTTYHWQFHSSLLVIPWPVHWFFNILVLWPSSLALPLYLPPFR